MESDDRDLQLKRLQTAYDADAVRRSGMAPEPWRIGIIDRWIDELETLGATSILEIGAGTGQLAVHVASTGLRVTAIDLSPANVAAAIDRGIDAQVADFAELPFPDETFDAAFGFNSLLHVRPDDLNTVLSEVRRVVRPSALLLVVVWGGADRQGPLPDDWLDPPRHFSFYTDDDMANLSSPGWLLQRFDTLPEPNIGDELHPQIVVMEAV